jgi:hypothetical protein
MSVLASITDLASQILQHIDQIQQKDRLQQLRQHREELKRQLLTPPTPIESVYNDTRPDLEPDVQSDPRPDAAAPLLRQRSIVRWAAGALRDGNRS